MPNSHVERLADRRRAIDYWLRFSAVIAQRKQIVFAALAVGAVVGGIYYFTTLRTYRAEAVLLLTADPAELARSAGAQPFSLDHRLPTYVELFDSAVVLEGALRRVQELPPEARVDFAHTPRESWREKLKGQLSVTGVDEAEVIIVACRSSSADAAPLLVDAVVTSFIASVKLRHKERAAELLATLQRQRLAVEQRLLEKRQALVALRERLRESPTLVDKHSTTLQLAEIDVGRMSAAHEALAGRILDVEIHQSHPPVRFDIVSPAQPAQRPEWPRLWIIALASLCGGLSIGIGIVVALEAVDDRFRSPGELRACSGAPLLALVGQLPVCDGVGLAALQMHAAPHSPESEAFRTLRGALDFADRRWSRLTITSSRAGDGKTTILANLAVAFAQAGKRTLVVDADLRRGGLTKSLNLRGTAGLSDLLARDDASTAAAGHAQATGIANLYVLPCGRCSIHDVDLLSSERMMQIIAWASEAYDQVLIDAPPVLAASDAAVVGRMCDGVLLVMQPAVSRRRDVLRAVEQINNFGAVLVGMIANRAGQRAIEFGGFGEYVYRYGGTLDNTSAHDESQSDDEANTAAANTLRRPPLTPSHEVLPRRVA